MTPLALEMLIRWSRPNNGLSVGEGPSEARDAHAELEGDGLVVGYEVTDRGRAYIAMILETPLPVQQWVDPRDGLGFVMGLEGRTVTALADGLTPRQRAQRDRRAREAGKMTFVPKASDIPAVAAAIQEALADDAPIPPGFNAWDGSAATPPGLKPDQPVEVMRRNGKIVSKVGGDQLYAVSVNWKHNGKPDDTIAYRLTTDPLDMEE